MSETDHYFTFPLAALRGSKNAGTPLEVLELCLHCGILNAGIGYRKLQGHDVYKQRLTEECDKLELGKATRPGPCSHKGEIIVGAALCNVDLRNCSPCRLEIIENNASSVANGGPLVRMSSASLWAALYQARWEDDPATNPHPDRGVSWREFRILAAILSMKTNRFDFCFAGWEMIQARSCGFTTKEAFTAAASIPDHLAPPLTRKQIRTTCDTLEALGFYARFRMSSGKRGGLTAYSFRHEGREALGNAVCEHINFRDRASIKANRAKDAEKCLELLERAKVGPSSGQQ